VKALDVTPDDNRLLVVFNGQSIVDNAGTVHDRYGVAFLRLSDYRVNDYRTRWFEESYERCSQSSMQLRDAELSPDGSMLVIVEKGNFRCDKIVALPAANDGTNDPLWVTAAHDSVFSVAVTDAAVYAGGHFCFVTAHGPISATDAATYPWVAKPEACDITNGNATQGDFIARNQIAALDPATGEPLDWNPGSNALAAVWHIEVIDRGLLLGQDNDRINTFRTGHHAFLDFGGTTPPFVPPAPAACAASVDNAGVVSLDWDSIAGATSYVIRKNDSWVASTTDTTATDTPAVGTYEYVIRYRINGVVTDMPCSPTVEVTAPTFACTADVTDDDVLVSWTSQPGVSNYQVRRDGGWLASSSTLSYTDQDLGLGTYTYSVRYRIGGATTDVACSPSTVTIEGETMVCTRDGANLSWNAIDGVTSYQVRKNGGWFAGTSATTFVDETATGADSYAIRYRQSGQTITVDCG